MVTSTTSTPTTSRLAPILPEKWVPLDSSVLGSNNLILVIAGENHVLPNVTVEKPVAPSTKNAARYPILPNQVHQAGFNSWYVTASAATTAEDINAAYMVSRVYHESTTSFRWQCTCPHFTGRTQFTNFPYCKHIHAVHQAATAGYDSVSATRWVWLSRPRAVAEYVAAYFHAMMKHAASLTAKEARDNIELTTALFVDDALETFPVLKPLLRLV